MPIHAEKGHEARHLKDQNKKGQEVQAQIKMEPQDPSASWESFKAGDRDSYVVQVKTVKEFLSEKSPVQIKKEPEEDLQQSWETQLQELLKSVESPQSAWRPPTSPDPIYEEDMDELQDSMKEMASVSLWPRGEWAAPSPMPALGEAGKPKKGLESSMKVKEEVVSEDATHAETQRQRFRHFCYQEAEGPREVCKQLWRLCHQWLKPDRRSKDQIVDALILEQFLNVLPWEMQSWVREWRPESCSQAVALAEDFLGRWQEPEQWQNEEPQLAVESVVSTPKTQISVETKQKEVNGQVEEHGEVSFPIERTEQGRLCGISFQGLEVDLMPGSPLKPRSHWENHLGKATQHTFLHEERDVGLHKDAFPEGIIQFDVKKEQVDNRGFKQHNGQAVQIAEKPYTCLYCGKTSNCKANLVVHERTHTGEKPYACLDCGKSFNRKSTLVRHKRMHTGEKPYECAECGRRFSIRCNLINHERIHTGEKPYSCSDCGQRFSRRLQLVIHRRTHTGETPYRCAQCGKCFTRRSSLLTHERIHTGEKPNTCTDCGKSFIQKGYLLIHRRIHTGERPYKCTSCEQRFLNRSDLRRHEKIHAGANPASC
ncbi:uncharacterized protein LOC110090348 [Pogona vitticeps]